MPSPLHAVHHHHTNRHLQPSCGCSWSGHSNWSAAQHDLGEASSVVGTAKLQSMYTVINGGENAGLTQAPHGPRMRLFYCTGIAYWAQTNARSGADCPDQHCCAAFSHLPSMFLASTEQNQRKGTSNSNRQLGKAADGALNKECGLPTKDGGHTVGLRRWRTGAWVTISDQTRAETTPGWKLAAFPAAAPDSLGSSSDP